jgi:hypothetical protein
MTISRIAAALALALLAGCAPADRETSASSAKPHGPEWDDTAGTAAAQALALRTSTREPGALPTVAAAPVQGWTGPGDTPFEVALRTAEQRSGHTRAFGTIAMQTSLRGSAPDLGSYPCTSCHFGGRVTMTDTRVTDAHQNIQPVHPAQLGAVCSTCHAPDNVERLALKSAERSTFDHAYRLCAQCHFAQAEAWAGGGHGKRLDGWQGRRVVMNCVDCHDPHRPAIEPRTPFRAPQLERARGFKR